MSRYWRSYSYGWRGYRDRMLTQREELSSTFGGIDGDVERIFLALDWADLNRLLARYERQYGSSAATYARNTYARWRSGSVRMSGRVAERLLVLLPPLLSDQVRFELIKKLRKANFQPAQHTVSTTTDRWREDLTPAVHALVQHGRTAVLSEKVKARAAWLADGNAAAAEKLLLAAEEDEARLRLAYLRAEFERIGAIIASLNDLKSSISHRIELPQGSINVYIVTPRKTIWQKLRAWVGEK